MVMNSVRKRFFLFGILLTIIVTIGLIVQYVHLNRILSREKKESIDKSIEYMGYQINSNLKYHSQYTLALAEYIAVENWTKEELKEYFDRLLANNPYIKSIYFADIHNNLTISGYWNPPEDYDWTSREWYQKALKYDDIVYSDVFLDAIDNKPIIAISKAVYNKNNELLGVVACDLSLKRIIDIVEETEVEELGYSFLVDGTGNIIAHPGYRENPDIGIININSVSESLHSKLKETKGGEMEIELEGVLGRLYYLPIENTEWIIGNFMSLKELKRSEWDLIDLYTTSLGTSFIVFLIFIYLQDKNIVGPIVGLDEDIRKINIEENLGYRIPVNPNDPFAELRTSINSVLDKTQEFFQQIEYDKKELLNKNKELMDSYNELAENIEQRKALEEKLIDLSYRDQLTGLYNRRFFEEVIHDLDEERYLPLSIIMADVNGLKLINDSFGHFMGDELLKSVSNIIKKGIREKDIACRLSGDEFVIVLPNTGKEEAEKIVERFKELSCNRRFLKEIGLDIEISIAYGIGVKDKIDLDISQVIRKAEDYMYSRKLFESPSMRTRTIETIISFLYEKSKREETHSKRVAELCKQMAMALGLTKEKVDEMYTAGLLHDIGKIAIESEILDKVDPYNIEEWESLTKHPEIGYRILSTVNDMGQIAEYVLYHHERYDGLGHPKGLKGEEIPLESRIIAIADVYEVLSFNRSHRMALSQEELIEKLLANAGKRFDPELLNIFIEKVLKLKLAEA